MADEGFKTVVVSTDPAHSLGDALQMDLRGGGLKQVGKATAGEPDGMGSRLARARVSGELRLLAIASLIGRWMDGWIGWLVGWLFPTEFS